MSKQERSMDRSWYSERQRTLVLTFESPEAAIAWDVAGRPLDVVDFGVDIQVDP